VIFTPRRNCLGLLRCEKYVSQSLTLEYILEYNLELLIGEDVPVPIVKDFMSSFRKFLSTFQHLIYEFPENIGVPVGLLFGSLFSEVFLFPLLFRFTIITYGYV